MRTSVTRLRVPGVIRRCAVLATLIVIGLMASSRSHAQTTERISTVNVLYRFSDFPAISADGRYVDFVSAVTGIDTASSTDTGFLDVYVRDRLTSMDPILLVSEYLDPDTNSVTEPNGHSSYPSISADGRWIAFQSRAPNMELALLDDDPMGQCDPMASNTWSIFIRNREAVLSVDNNVVIASFGLTANSTTDVRCEADGESRFPAISGNGRHVAFASKAKNLVDAPNKIGSDWDIYVYNRDPSGTGTLDGQNAKITLVSVSTAGGQAAAPSNAKLKSSFPSISGDGRYIAFATNATNLVGGDMNDDWDVFVRDRDPDGDGVFDETDAPGTTIRISRRWDGSEAIGASRLPAISADGRYVAFVSWDDQIVAGDTNGQPDVFLHDRDANENGVFDEPGFTATTLVSMNPATGAIGDGPSGCPGCRPSISPDGQYVAFASAASNLVANDTNNAWDVFVRGMRLHQDLNDPNVIIEVDETFRVSVANDGSEANFASFAPSVTQDLGWIITAFHSHASNIDPDPMVADSNEAKDVFVRIVPVNEP